MKKLFGFVMVLCFLIPSQFLSASIMVGGGGGGGPSLCYYNHFYSRDNIFQNVQSHEYVNGLLRIHFKLQDSNELRMLYPFVDLYDSDCNHYGNEYYNWGNPPVIMFTPHTINFSLRFTSPTNFVIWNDDTNELFNCSLCAVDFKNFGYPNNLQAVFYIGDYYGYNKIGSDSLSIVEPSAIAQKTPVLIIPGILGSAQKNGVWVIDPIFHTYDDLIDTLAANGYEKGKTLFDFPYDWRNSNVLTAVSLRDKINEVKNICQCSKVDLVAHSMGGLVARQYIESDYYGNDVDHLIFLGTPHLGAPVAYLPWEGADVPLDPAWIATKYLLKWDAYKLGMNLFDYIHQNVLSVSQLLPTYNYLVLKNNGTEENYPSGYPTNPFLETLNSNTQKLLSSGVKITNIIGDAGTSTISSIIVASSTVASLWEYGQPDVLNNGIGDDTVPLTSSGYIGGDVVQTNYKHINLPTKTEGIVFKKLTGKDAQTLIDKGLQIDIIALIKILSPADIQVVAPDGKRIGKDFATGQEISEIPGAFYSGFQTDDEYVAIPNPLDGEYKVVTQGTGNGGEYTIATGYITPNGSSENNFVGQTLPDMITPIDISISNANQSIEVKPEDIIPPTITVVSPEFKDYLRSNSITINATSADAGTGVFSFGLAFDNRQIKNGDSIDLFYEKLGNHSFTASSTDFVGNLATSSVNFRIIATPESSISDVEKVFTLGWLKNKGVKNSIESKLKTIVRLEKRIETIQEKVKGKTIYKKVEVVEKIIDKVLCRLFLAELKLYKNGKILNEQAYQILLDDVNWLINN